MTATESSRSPGAAEHEGLDRIGDGSREVTIRRYVRSPQDVLRLAVFGMISLSLTAFTIWLEDSVTGLEEDIVNLFGFLSPAIERVLNGSVEIVAAMVGIAVFLVPLITRRYRLFGYIIASNMLAFSLMSGVRWLVDRETSSGVINELAERAGITADGTTSGSVGVAQLAATFIVLAPFVTRSWRRAGAVTITVILLVRLLVAPRLPAEVFLSLPVGAFCGALVLLAFGRPDRRPTLAAIATALDEAGLAVSEVHPASVDARGSTPYFATMVDGTGLFVKVLGSQERAADLLFRMYRLVRFKNVGDDRPFSSLRRAIEHEALIALLARDVGIRTPRLRGIVDVGADSMLLAYEMIDGASLDSVPDERVTDELMGSIWSQIAELRTRRIAHRDLRRANVFVGSDEVPWIIDFGFSEAAVAQPILDADVAQMMASLAVVVGAERAAVAAIDVLGTEAVGDALPRLQSKALSGATQTALKEHPGLLEELQQQVIDRCSVDQVEFVALERANRKTILMVVVLALATYFLFPQLADLPGIVDQVRDAQWGWTPLIILAAAMTYVGAAVGIAGSIPDRLQGGPLFLASLASSFASKLAPAGLGGMALYVRFLQKQGVDRAVAVSGVGLNTVAGVFAHLALIGVFLIWAGRDAFGSFSLPDPKWFVVGLGIIAVLAVVAVAIPGTRRMIRERLVPVLARAFDGVGEVLRRPGKALMLFGGSTVLTLAYLTTLYFSIAAFGGGLPFATVGAVYLVGSAVAQAAPTPGGLGAVEAALISGLVAAGLDDTIAVPAVFLYRLFTFWVPVLPGWISFQWLQRHEFL